VKIDSKKYPQPKRFRHHTAPNLYFPWEELKDKPEYYPPLYDKLNWSDIFINGGKPNVLDIGCGKGKLLLDHSEMYPSENILGIEVRSQPVDWLNNVIKGEQIPNAAVLWYSVVNGLPFINDGSVDKVLYLFPDPWFKYKHKKRRAFNEKTIGETYRVLKRGGTLYLASDVPEVNDYHKKILDRFGRFSYTNADDNTWKLPITNKEKFCRNNKIDYLRIKCVKS
jgi:tRNA (guanine-N7-)-methyltransferase